MSTSLTLLIVDGHPGVREALLRRLEHVPGVGMVAAVGSIGAGVRLAQEFVPDAVIYEPKTVAGDAVEAITRLAGGCPVVVLTSSLLEEEAAALARAGAAALLLKGSSIAELVSRIETAIAARAGTHPG